MSRSGSEDRDSGRLATGYHRGGVVVPAGEAGSSRRQGISAGGVALRCRRRGKLTAHHAIPTSANLLENGR
jgi:hypothetical protein